MKLVHFSLIGAIAFGAGLSMTGSSAMAQMPFPTVANTPGFSTALSASPPYTCTTNYYIDPVNGKDTNAGTIAAPWLTLFAPDGATNGDGHHVPKPGDCYNALPGTYSLPTTVTLRTGGNSNTATGYVVYRSTVPQGAHVIAGSGFGTSSDIFQLQVPYIIFDGFEIDGNKDATQGDGIDGCALGGQKTTWIAHHFIAINNKIHDVGGAGVSSCNADFIIWRNNVIYNTATSSPFQKSGFDINGPQGLTAGTTFSPGTSSYIPTAWDTATTHGIQILYNIAHNNVEGPTITGGHTDGNGIIIDTSDNCSSSPTCSGETAYPGQILIMGNLSYSNGGGGVHVYLSENVTVANNTCYNNYTDTSNSGTDRGELSNFGSANVNFINNVAIAVPGAGVLANNRPAVSTGISGSSAPYNDSGTWNRNIYFGAPNVSDANSNANAAGNLINVNPKLSGPASGIFTPLPGSPTTKTGLPASYLPSKTPDIGAY